MKKSIIATLIVSSLALIGVSSLTGSSAQTKFPIGIKHDTGETILNASPKRIIALHPTSLEILLVLGVQPVGVGAYGRMQEEAIGTAANSVPNYDDLLTSKPVHVGSEPSLEVMTALKPDLILSIDFAAQDVFPQFSKVAPTLVYDFSAAGGWEKGLRDMGKLLGHENKAEAVIRNLESKARLNRNRLAARLSKGNSLAVFALRGPQLLATGPGFSPSRLLIQLGFKNVAAADAPVFAPMSPEGLLSVKADRAMLLNFGAPKETLESTVALLKRGNFKGVHSIEMLTASRSGLGPLSEAQLLDAYTKAILK
jgi:ABC-type Fe3+-hydroxamate transport system substrate-binding protein